ncbi:hypothetical protein FOA52_002869 [Chlamydomonas sp. UWO 241]|nr:hypothetical protein FOA52_002869 [Chlamydomonas sp. UWO 241]
MIAANYCVCDVYGCKAEATLLLQEWVRDVGSVAGLNAANTKLATGAVGVSEARMELEVTLDSLSDWESFLGRIPSREHRAWGQRIQSMVVNSDSPKWEIFRDVPLDVDAPGAPPARAAAAGTPSSRPVQAPPPLAAAAQIVAGRARSGAAAGAAPAVRSSDAELMSQLSASLSAAATPGRSSQACNLASAKKKFAWSSSAPGGPNASPIEFVSQMPDGFDFTDVTYEPTEDDAPGSGGTGSGGLLPVGEDAAAGGGIMLDWKGEPMKLNPGDKLPFKFL